MNTESLIGQDLHLLNNIFSRLSCNSYFSLNLNSFTGMGLLCFLYLFEFPVIKCLMRTRKSSILDLTLGKWVCISLSLRYVGKWLDYEQFAKSYPHFWHVWYSQSFEDEVESGHGVSMYPTNESTADVSSVTFEPLPDILAKTVGSRALRPRITCSDEQRQTTAAKLVSKLFVWKYFCRGRILYENVLKSHLNWAPAQ